MDITFYNKDQSVFNYRVCGVICDDKRILLHRGKEDNFWALAGGRVEMLESSDCAIKREIKEELGEEVEIDRPLWTVENFFSFDDQNYHELSIIYLINLQKNSWILEEQDGFSGVEGERLIFRWFHLNELEDLNIKPTFLKEKLKSLPNSIEHIVHNDITSANS